MTSAIAKAHVLVVDDTAVDRQLAGGLLEMSAHIVVKYAEDGQQAVEMMLDDVPDIVVTDMHMPNLNGLQLVSHIRMHFPQTPVVLMTAQGSESVAVEALERGAASYVPKSQLAEMLQTTVEDLLTLVRSEESHSRLVDAQQRLELHYELENDPELIDALIETMQQMVGGMNLTDETGKLRVGVALREALYNALYHGNLEITDADLQDSRDLLAGNDPVEARRHQLPYSERKIRVHVTMDRNEARFVIEDDGTGFDYANLLTQMDPGTTGGLGSDQGRGFVLMLSMMDEVSFNESGNCVTLVKQRETAPVAAGV